MEWFAERVDRIILLFDAHKLDISDEFSDVIKALKNHEDKIRYRMDVLLTEICNSRQWTHELYPCPFGHGYNKLFLLYMYVN